MPNRLLTLEQAKRIRQLKKDKPHLSYGQIKIILHLDNVGPSTLWLVINRPNSYTNERTGYFKLTNKERIWIRLKMKGYRRKTKERCLEVKRIAKGYGVCYQTIYKLLRKAS
jgi:hypothetical protein